MGQWLATVLVVTSIVAILVAVVQVVRSWSTLGSLETGLGQHGNVGVAINGDWWQIVHAMDHPGLTHIRIAVSDGAEKPGSCRRVA